MMRNSGKPEFRCNPSNLRKNFLAKKMDARVKPAHDRWRACYAGADARHPEITTNIVLTR